MNQLFVHRHLFRILSPLFSGAIVYLLILLVNNNVMALEQQFLGQELYFCIGLAYLIQESSRFSILMISKLGHLSPTFWGIVIPALISSVTTIVVVSGSMYLYFEWVLGFSPIITEMTIFNAIFLMITWIYLVLFISHDLLKKTHESYLSQEEELKSNVQRDFVEFKQGVNPELLFESLEQLIILAKQDVDKAEEFLDQLAVVYRYVLSKKQELVSIKAEVDALEQFVTLLNSLPNRELIVRYDIKSSFVVVPGVLVKSLEMIFRAAVVHQSNIIDVHISESEEVLEIKASMIERLVKPETTEAIFNQLYSTYTLYTDSKMKLKHTSEGLIISIPKLTLA